jgi:hypothetical protein
MALFDTDKAGVLWDAVSLPNAFICEYMPAAPEGYVKVYLYGLMYARYPAAADGLTPDALAKELSMTENEVLSAFQYWERCRLVARTQDKPPRLTYLPGQQARTGRQAAPGDEADAQFAQASYAIFGNRRAIHGGELGLCYEWVEQLGLPREVVLEMIQHMVTTNGVNFDFKTAQKFALELVDHGIVTLEAAEKFFARSLPAWTGARRVLHRISRFREPTIDEIDLYLKWTKEWGFTQKAVEKACGEMQGVSDPNFKYLEGCWKACTRRRPGKNVPSSWKELEAERTKPPPSARCCERGAFRKRNQELVREVYRHMREKLPTRPSCWPRGDMRTKKTQCWTSGGACVRVEREGARTPGDVEAH